ncbi:MAG: MerR family transcriptional regulator [Nannocystales bacterium]
MTLYRIGDVARRARLKPSAIRYYEDEGLIPAPLRRSGRRMFGEEIFDHLAWIAACQAAGFSLTEIRGLKDQLEGASAPGPQLRAVVSQKHEELDRAAARLRQMKSMLSKLEHCSCPTMADCGRAARKLGASEGSEFRCGSRRFGR